MYELPDADALRNRLIAVGVMTDTQDIPTGMDLDDEMDAAIAEAGRIAGVGDWTEVITEARWYDNPKDGVLHLGASLDGNESYTIYDQRGENLLDENTNYVLQPYNERLKDTIRFMSSPIGTIRAIKVEATWTATINLSAAVHFAILDLAVVRVLDIVSASNGAYKRIKMGTTEMDFENNYPKLREKLWNRCFYVLREFGQ